VFRDSLSWIWSTIDKYKVRREEEEGGGGIYYH